MLSCRCGNAEGNWKSFLVRMLVTYFETSHPIRFLEVWPKLSTRTLPALRQCGWTIGQIFSTK